MRRRRILLLLIPVLLAVLAYLGWRIYPYLAPSPTRPQLMNWLRDPSSRAALITNLTQPCPGAPFRLPSVGFVGFLYDDSTGPYNVLNPHPGIDIFGNGDVGTVPIYAAYDGYLTRLSDWKSSVIIRIPSDPLNPSRQIWTYYAHMANRAGTESYISADFPPGTSEKFVKQGTLLGYQGQYSGPGYPPIATHVHFSIVASDDNGSFRNEARFNNTLDPSPYFGLTVNASRGPIIPVRCGS
ncbi:MAG: M23 family metallopeptidase [Anaerolineae bacterium]|nr:M23 family metallopeptidase [Anaerolineae bacterium]